MSKKIVVFIVLLSFFCTFLSAIETKSNDDNKITLKIEPYTKENTPQWLKDVRRTEIITIGSLPFSILASTLSYSLYRYISHNFDAAYIPNPFAKTSDAAKLSIGEQQGILIAGACLSVSIGIADLIVQKVLQSKQKKEKSQHDAIANGSIVITGED